jgi:hypothetical protein
MKAKKLSKKLMLNKKTIASLNESEMNSAQGGEKLIPMTPWCPTTSWFICCI